MTWPGWRDQGRVIGTIFRSIVTVASRRPHTIAINPRWTTSSWADAWLDG